MFYYYIFALAWLGVLSQDSRDIFDFIITSKKKVRDRRVKTKLFKTK